jgi:hypothetical protein
MNPEYVISHNMFYIYVCVCVCVCVSEVELEIEMYSSKKKKTPWSESASELYRPSDRRLSAKYCQLVRIEGATWSA